MLAKEHNENPLLMGLNDNQKLAVTTINGNIRINAIAGCGKTRVLVNRVAYMVENGVNPSEILVTTFTKKASTEMIDRLSKLIDAKTLNALTIGTSHSIGYRILKEEFKNLNHPLYKAFSQQLLINYEQKKFAQEIRKSLLKRRDIEKEIKGHIESIGLSSLLSVVGLYKNKGMDSDAFLTSVIPSDRNMAYYEFFNEYEYQKQVQKRIDTDDLLYLFVKLLKENPVILKKYQKQYKYLLVDESQDNNYMQYELIRLFGYPQYNLFIVGDDDQCQPTGCKVLTSNGYINIEDLNENIHKIPVYDKHSGYIIGLRNGCYSFKKTSRDYKGSIYNISIGNRKTKCTNNHKWLIKWNKENKDNLYVVYMMKKDDKYRIGWCKLFNNEGAFHLGQRSRNEKAESTWILKTFNNKTDASIYESYIATKYGLPLLTFEEVENAKHMTKQSIETFFNMVTSFIGERAIKCLQDHDLELNYPLWTQEKAYNRRGGNSIIEIETCNMIDGLMLIPIQTKGRNVKWEIANISKEYYEGKVYSLDVEKYHTYITDDGIVTHNCMYSFRGAEPQQFIDFTKNYQGVTEINLDMNYRSKSDILEKANKLIANNTNRIQKIMIPSNITDEKAIFYNHYDDEMAESENIVNEVILLNEKENVHYKNMACLMRTNKQSLAIENALIMKGIPYILHGGLSFYERKEVKDIISYLQLVHNTNNNKAFERVINVPSRFLGKAFIEKLKGVKKTSLWDACNKISMKGYEDKGVNEFKSLVNSLKKLNEQDEPIAVLVDCLLESGYKAYLLDDENEQSDSRMENVEALKYLLSYFENLESFLSYVEKMTGKAKHSVDGVQLMTIHKSKGLEFDTVFGMGVAENLLPHYKSIEKSEEQTMNGELPMAIEEERRLAYVMVTRAEKRCYVSSIDSYNGKYAGRSRFIEEMGLELIPVMDEEEKEEITE